MSTELDEARDALIDAMADDIRRSRRRENFYDNLCVARFVALLVAGAAVVCFAGYAVTAWLTDSPMFWWLTDVPMF